jgi:hypothetical protein
VGSQDVCYTFQIRATPCGSEARGREQEFILIKSPFSRHGKSSGCSLKALDKYVRKTLVVLCVKKRGHPGQTKVKHKIKKLNYKQVIHNHLLEAFTLKLSSRAACHADALIVCSSGTLPSYRKIWRFSSSV